MTAALSRTARLVLVTPEGSLIGCLPPIPVRTPYWQDISPVVEAARAHFGIDLIVLRLLETEILGSSGGEVTYLAEAPASFDSSAHPVAPWHGVLADHSLRLPYAKPGGPTADLQWAEAILQRHGFARAGEPMQIRTWNLSSIWRIPLASRNAWLKVVPPFFAHEGALLERLCGQRVPRLIGHDGCRSLLDEVPGEDLYVADLTTHLAMVDLLVEIQAAWMNRTEELSAIGLRDYTGNLQSELELLLELRADELLPADKAVLENFLGQLPARLRKIEECGPGSTLVHGDFHPGNLRGDGTRLTLIDWGDSGIGNPLLDQSAFLERVRERDIPEVRQHWANRWRQTIAGCDPERAAELIRPIASAHRAVQYQMFLDNIEPSERVYHHSDPADWLHQTALDFEAERSS